jgi:hypothetical protein
MESSQEELVELLVDGARYGDMEDVKAALDQGVDANAADSMGRTGAPSLFPPLSRNACQLNISVNCATS